MNFDDPRLTAYALGELDSADDRLEIERLLRDSPEARAEYEEVRALTATLRRDLHAEPEPSLTGAQRSDLIEMARNPALLNGSAVSLAPTGERIVHLSWWRQRWIPASIAAVALFATAVVTLWEQQNTQEQYREILTRVPAPSTPSADSDFALAPSNEAAPGHEPATLNGRLADMKQQAPGGPSTPEHLAELPAAAAMPEESKKESQALLKQLAPGQEAAKPVDALRREQVEWEERGRGDTRGVELKSGLGGRPKLSTSSAAVSADAEQKMTEPALPALAAATPMDLGLADEQRSRGRIEDSWSKTRSSASAHEPASAAPGAVPAPARQMPTPAPEGRTLSFRGQATGGSQTAAKDSDYGNSVDAARSGGLQPEQERLFLGREYKLRNFREESELNRYAIVIPVTPGIPMPQEAPVSEQLAPAPTQEHNTESYDSIQDNPFLSVRENPLSTFSIDVDTASYANVRRFLNSGSRPPKGAVRIEELVNYFTYDYPQPAPGDPFSCTLEVADCPWEPQHRLVRVGLKGRELPAEERPASNLIFLVDVSGSMQPQNKLPLVKESLLQMVNELGPKDTVGIAVYAGASGVVLEPTSDRGAIRAALSRLESGGSTNGAAGIQLAYDLAKRAFIKEGNNRVILATDGDFNVGVTNRSELVEVIEKRAKEGVFLTILGFGMGNLKDATLEQLSNKGNGNYAYIDTLREGRKVLIEQMSGTLFTIAKDVKIQVEFNPAQVSAYRLIGYENRLLRKEDFNDDTKDAGEIGAGHTVTALYQVVPAGVQVQTSSVDPLKYQSAPQQAAPPSQPKLVESAAAGSAEMLTLKLRFKQPDGDTSTLREFPLTDGRLTWERSSRDFRFAAAVAGFGMLLRDSPHKGNATWDAAMELAVEGKGEDAAGYRQEFIGLIEKAKSLR